MHVAGPPTYRVFMFVAAARQSRLPILVLNLMISRQLQLSLALLLSGELVSPREHSPTCARNISDSGADRETCQFRENVPVETPLIKRTDKEARSLIRTETRSSDATAMFGSTKNISCKGIFHLRKKNEDTVRSTFFF